MFFPSSRHRGRALGSTVLFLAALLILFYGITLLRGIPEISAPEVALDNLNTYIDSDRLIRVRARLISDPAISDPGGKTLALQRVQVVGEEAQVLYDETVPALLWISDAKNTVAVDPGDFDIRALHAVASDQVKVRGELPADVRTTLLSEFNDAPAPLGGFVHVWNIEQGAEVTLLGTVRLEGDQPLFTAPAEGETYIISPLTDAEIAARVGAYDVLTRARGWSLILAGALLLFISLKRARRRRPRADMSS